ncbi:MAG: Acylphosphatase [Candidatus Anoxychlamydiales bacterium]|nr:Acylphosphatase [Candidatus Anoxychlamydiales bacterium]NGX40465.1 Acylphosphatase [Candidatus Anoxychlamydiales bacterium]
MKEIVQLHAIFKGNVQDVFFRQQVKVFAEELKITGYVKNLRDGSVEVLAIGDREILEKFLKEIEKKPGHGSIASIKKNFTKKEISFDRFEIRY